MSVRRLLFVGALSCLLAAIPGLPFVTERALVLHALLLDLSRSHGVRSDLLLDAALEEFPPDDSGRGDLVCIVVYGAGSTVLLAPSAVEALDARALRERLPGPSFREGSDLLAARDSLFAVAPRGMALDVLVLGDGRHAAEEWAALREAVASRGGHLASGGPLLPADEDVALSLSGPPPALLGGQRQSVPVRIDGRIRGRRVVIVRSGEATVEVALSPGVPALLSLPVAAPVDASSVRIAIVSPGGPDVFGGNDHLELPVSAPTRRDVAIVGPRSAELADELRSSGLRVILQQSGLDPAAAGLERAEALVLADVAVGAGGIDAAGVTWLKRRVSRDGMGLVVLGGPRAFAAGGYGSSGLEGFLPLSSRPAGRRRVVVLLDRSGSMEREGRLGRAVAAVRRLAAGLGAGDRLQVLPFATEVGATVPPRAAEPAALLGAAGAPLDRIVPSGSTRLEPALRAACELLAAEDSGRARLVVILSDFRDQALDAAAPALRLALARDRCELVCVLLDPDVGTRGRCAALGGRLVAARGITPELLLRALLGAGWRVEKREILAEGRSVGSLRARNAVRAGPDATMAWHTREGEPVLGTARRGAGRVSALATEPLLEGWTRSALSGLVRQVLPERRAGMAWWSRGDLLFTLPEPLPPGGVTVHHAGRVVRARELAPARFVASFRVPGPGPARVLAGGGRLIGTLRPAPAPDPEFATPVSRRQGQPSGAPTSSRGAPLRWPLLLAALLLLMVRLVLAEVSRPGAFCTPAESFSAQARQAGGR